MGKKNNQTFVQIPFRTLIEMIKYKGEAAGIRVVVCEESYTIEG
ncbi:IS200/IS605 family accessory protein TnpB-related protein [[Clostridium] innocuum]|nr:IS200/IS605 family accessory protein TnpB-related protein [[Clostridium] innocuum]